MKSYFGFLLFFLVFPVIVTNGDTTTYGVEWSHTYGGPYSDIGSSVTESSDGGFIIVGSSDHRDPSYDVLIIKTDKDGNELWNNTYGKILNSERAFHHISLINNGIAIIGITQTGNNKNAYFVSRVSESGEMLWNKTYDFTGAHGEHAYISETSVGNYIIAGTIYSGITEYDILVFQIDNEGNLLWNKTIGGKGYEVANSILKCANGDFILAGQINLPELESDCYVLRIDPFGEVSWNKTFGDSGYNLTHRISPQDIAKFSQETDEGDFYVWGQTQSFGAKQDDFLLIKLDSDGNRLWQKRFDGDEDEAAGRGGIITKDGDFVAVGSTWSSGSGIKYDVFVSSIHSNGTIEWILTFDDETNERGNNLLETSVGEYVIVGTTYSSATEIDVLLLKLSPGIETELDDIEDKFDEVREDIANVSDLAADAVAAAQRAADMVAAGIQERHASDTEDSEGNDLILELEPQRIISGYSSLTIILGVLSIVLIMRFRI
jgi:hypothetical protein